MNTGEFYSANEYNVTSEYQHFPAESYKRKTEENTCGNEDAKLGSETTSLQPITSKAKAKSSGKNLIDRLFGSIRGAATAAIASVALVVTTTTLASGAPNADLINLECGDTYIEYEIEVEGLQEDGEYAIVLSTSNEDDIDRKSVV